MISEAVVHNLPVIIAALGAAVIPSGLILFLLRGQKALDSKMSGISSDFKTQAQELGHVTVEIERLRKAKHEHANSLQAQSMKIALLEHRRDSN